MKNLIKFTVLILILLLILSCKQSKLEKIKDVVSDILKQGKISDADLKVLNSQLKGITFEELDQVIDNKNFEEVAIDCVVSEVYSENENARNITRYYDYSNFGLRVDISYNKKVIFIDYYIDKD